MATKYVLALLFLWLALPVFYSALATRRPKLRTIRTGSNKESVSYLVAGLLEKSAPAFQFLIDSSIFPEDTVVAVDYPNTGINYDHVYRAIIRDIESHDYRKIKIFAAGVGCIITHNANLYDYGIDCYEIQPCWTSRFFHPALGNQAPAIGMALLILADFLLGPLKFIPIIKNDGESFSIHLLLTQLWFAIDDSSSFIIPSGSGSVQLVVLAEKDNILSNSAIAAYYQSRPIITIPDLPHAHLKNAAHTYATAFEQFFASKA